MTNGNRKGKAGERELAKFLKKFGFEARRGQQFSGGGDSPDIVHNIPGVHIECKRVEALRLYPSIEQAEVDRKDEDIPAVFHRPSRKDWVVIMYAEDFLYLMKERDELRRAIEGCCEEGFEG